VQEVESAVRQAMMDAGLPPDAPVLDFTAFLTLLLSDLPDEDAPRDSGTASCSLQTFASMAPQRSAASGEHVSLSCVLRRACSTHLHRGLSLSQALSYGLSDCASGEEYINTHDSALTAVSSGRASAGKQSDDGGLATLRTVRSRAALAAVAEEAEGIADAGAQVGRRDGRSGIGRRSNAGVTDGTPDDGGEDHDNCEELASRWTRTKFAPKVNWPAGA
jgi:hypothetical protein